MSRSYGIAYDDSFPYLNFDVTTLMDLILVDYAAEHGKSQPSVLAVKIGFAFYIENVIFTVCKSPYIGARRTDSRCRITTIVDFASALQFVMTSWKKQEQTGKCQETLLSSFASKANMRPWHLVERVNPQRSICINMKNVHRRMHQWYAWNFIASIIAFVATTTPKPIPFEVMSMADERRWLRKRWKQLTKIHTTRTKWKNGKKGTRNKQNEEEKKRIVTELETMLGPVYITLFLHEKRNLSSIGPRRKRTIGSLL